AAEPGAHLFRHCGDGRLRRHIAFDGDGLAAGGFHQLHGLGAVAEIDDGDVDAVARQSPGEGLPYAAGGAGDDSDFVLVTFGHGTPRVLAAGSITYGSRVWRPP